jgi:hypothetical protein
MGDIFVAEHLSGEGGSYTWRYKHDWVGEVATIADSYGIPISCSAIMEIGAGVHNPLGSAIVALARGARLAVAVEPSPLVHDHVRHAVLLGLVSSYTSQCVGPLFRPALDFLIQVSSASPATGSLRAPGLEFVDTSIGKYECPESIDIVHSNAVLEHIMDLDTACARMFQITSPGGLHVHKVDFIDHRYYSLANPTPASAYRFLMKGEENAMSDCNGLRLSEVVSRFVQNGFEFVACPQKWAVAFPDDGRKTLRPRYRDMSQEDLETTCAVLVFRK